MAFTIINDCFFKPDGDLAEGKAAAATLVEYFKKEVPEVPLSLWLESEENPLHHYHMTVFDDADAAERVRSSDAIARFVKRLFPQIDHSTYVSPACAVWLAAGRGVNAVTYRPGA